LKTLSLILVLVFVVTSAKATTTSCRAALTTSSSSAIFPQNSEIQSAQKLSAKLMSDFEAQSKKTLFSLQNSSTSVVYDVIIVGAGPQAAAAALTLRNQPGLKALIIDKSALVASNFASKEFVINSSETDVLSMHQFPNSPLTFDQFSSSKYASSHQLAAFIQSLVRYSRVPVLLKTEMIGLSQIENGIIVVQTGNGLRLQAKNIVISTGLGEAGTKVSDPVYKALFDQAAENSRLNPGTINSIMNTESFMKAINHQSHLQKPLLLPKSILLFGNGDGARISVEEMGESFVHRPKDFKIHWLGNENKTVDAYKASQKKLDRYLERVIPFYERGEIEGYEGYVNKVEKLENGQFRVTTQEPQTGKVHVVIGDMIIDSTGYDNRSLSLISSTFTGSTLSDVKGVIAEFSSNPTTIAKQLITNQGQKVSIYVAGASAGPLATRDELTPLPNRNPISIFNNVSRTSELMAQIFQLPSPKRNNGVKNGRVGILSADQIYQAVH
jgi:hypothetical protein